MATKGDQYAGITGNIWNYAHRGDQTGVAAALSKGVDVNLQNKVGWTVVHAAARGGQVKLLQYLAGKGADLGLADHEGRTAAHEAARCGQLEALRALARLGADLRATTRLGQTALDLAKGQEVRQFLQQAMAGQPSPSGRQPAAQPPASAATGPSWRRAPGSGISTKTKREYLRWKRQQKQLQGGGSDSSEGEGEGGIWAPAEEQQEEERQQGAAGGSAAGDSAAAAAAAGLPVTLKAPRKGKASASDEAVQQVPLVEVAAAGQGGEGARLPHCVPGEVGWGPEGQALGMPVRPAWQGAVHSASELHALEEREFRAWLQGVVDRYPRSRLSFFETRLEFWRQLWRALERCDVALMICDARCPLLHFSGALAHYAGTTLARPLLLVLNKCDLVPPAAVAAWSAFFQKRYPGIRVVPTASNGGPEAVAESARSILSAVLACQVQRGGRQVAAAEVVAAGVDEVLKESAARNTHSKRGAAGAAAASSPGSGRSSSRASHASGGDSGSGGDSDSEGAGQGLAELSLAEGSGSGSDWDVRGTKAKRKVAVRRKKGGRAGAGAAAGQQQGSGQGSGRDRRGAQAAADADAGMLRAETAGDSGPSTVDAEERALQALMQQEEFDEVQGAGAGAEAAGVAGSGTPRPVVVAVVGEPNVGKSSTMNALLGGHRVAVSSHPGRTRHFQTLYMTPSLVLCDCPGLVFPRLDVALPLQVLYGSFPIARCQDPYSVVRYMAERCWPPLQQQLGLQWRHVAETGGEGQPPRWSPLALCEAYAAKHNWRSRRGGRLDTYRAANWMLRSALAGSAGLGLAFLPPAEEEVQGVQGAGVQEGSGGAGPAEELASA